MTTPATQRYSDLSATYLRKARVHLAEGDLTQASEKGWGAASVAVKACAESRDRAHAKHRHLWETIRLLIHETGDAEIRTLFQVAESLHANFYEDMLGRSDVEAGLSQIERLLEKLSPLA